VRKNNADSLTQRAHTIRYTSEEQKHPTETYCNKLAMRYEASKQAGN